MKKVLERRQRRSIWLNADRIEELKEFLPKVFIARSSELVAWAFESGVLDGELIQSTQALEASLYAVKYNGCSISNLEILKYLREVQKHGV